MPSQKKINTTIAIETAKFTKITVVIDPPTMCYWWSICM